MTTRRYKKQERHEQILLELKLKPHVRVAELAKQFGVTTETVRRDIEDLGRDGLLQRAHGGASARHAGAHHDLDARRHQRVAERERLGRFAASLVAEGSSIMVDAGATTMEFARFHGLCGNAGDGDHEQPSGGDDPGAEPGDGCASCARRVPATRGCGGGNGNLRIPGRL
ncbi:MAG: DeoR/GlpR family DNA-binding transcription regulator [Roseovarius pacificus]|nr:DeoR/GlpR family DNA-binding transcription regulator [Roseovarius pacificus]